MAFWRIALGLVVAAQLASAPVRAQQVDGEQPPAVCNPKDSSVNSPQDEKTVLQDDAPGSCIRTRIKEPAGWFSWGFDIRLRETYMNNVATLNSKDPNHETHWQRQRLRLWTTMTLLEDVEFNLRVAWEGKHFDKPAARENWQPTSTVFDRLNLKLSDIAGSGLTLTVGRQELMFGDRWLVLDGTPLDGSTTAYFDAVRLTLSFDETSTDVDLVFIDQDASQEHWVGPVVDEERFILEHNETGVIVWVSNRSFEETQIDGYFIYTRRKPVLANGDQAEIYTLGARCEHQFSDRLSGRVNLAGQFGRKNGERQCGLGVLSRLSYQLQDELESELYVDYEFLSGDKPGTEANEGFDVLWGRWPRFSDLYLYTFIGETRIGDYTNLHRISCGWSGRPSGKLGLKANYHLLFADQSTFEAFSGFSESGCFRGQLLVSELSYRFNEQLSGRLTGEAFFPGDYYSNERNDPAVFLRAEVSFRF